MIKTTAKIIIFTYYFVYKFIQQNIYIEILVNKKDFILTAGILPRVVALIVNFMCIVILEKYFPNKTVKKIVLSVYTSLLIILLFIFKDIDICEISLFLLNLTICESLLYHNFLMLWQIQLCLEFSILTNYITQYISLSFSGHFIPIYVLWIWSILLANTRIRRSSIISIARAISSTVQIFNIITPTLLTPTAPSPIKRLNHNRHLRLIIKKVIHTLMQILFFISIILLGCTTIRNNIFTIFNNENISLKNVSVLMSIICTITISSVILPRLNISTRLIIVLILILTNYIVSFFIKHYAQITIFSPVVSLILNIIFKKVLGFCKCCMISLVMRDINGNIYRKNIKCRLLKYLIINSDSLSFIINTYMHTDTIDLNLVNLFVFSLIIVLYNIFVNL